MFITQLRINFSMLRNLTHTICIAAKSSCKKDHGISSYVIASSMAHFHRSLPVENPLDDIVIKNHSQKKDLSYLGGNGGLVVENQ